VNAIVLELPLGFSRARRATSASSTPGRELVLKAAHKIETTMTTAPAASTVYGLDQRAVLPANRVRQSSRTTSASIQTGCRRGRGLNERLDERQIGADNETLALHFVTRLAHLGWGFGPSISALGLGTCFDHSNSPVSVYKTYALATEAFPRVKNCLLQEVNMPDDSWNKHHLSIALKRTFEIFIPNVCAVDMDTTGSWPYGRRLEDQVANRFLALFLDMRSGCGGGKCNVETLSSQALWDAAPVEPKTSPNPLHNDVPFLTHFRIWQIPTRLHIDRRCAPTRVIYVAVAARRSCSGPPARTSG